VGIKEDEMKFVEKIKLQVVISSLVILDLLKIFNDIQHLSRKEK